MTTDWVERLAFGPILLAATAIFVIVILLVLALIGVIHFPI